MTVTSVTALVVGQPTASTVSHTSEIMSQACVCLNKRCSHVSSAAAAYCCERFSMRKFPPIILNTNYAQCPSAKSFFSSHVPQFHYPSHQASEPEVRWILMSQFLHLLPFPLLTIPITIQKLCTPPYWELCLHVLHVSVVKSACGVKPMEFRKPFYLRRWPLFPGIQHETANAIGSMDELLSNMLNISEIL